MILQPVVPGVYQISFGMVSAYLIDDDADAVARWQIDRGDFLNDQARVYALAEPIYPALCELLEWNMPLEADSDGHPRLKHTAGFSSAYWTATFDTPG